MTIQKKYARSEEGVIGSYTFSEISEGTGSILFYLFSSQDDTTGDYHLSQNAFYSHDIEYDLNTLTDTTSFTKQIDVDFDLSQFNLPQRIEGTAYVNITLQIEGTSTNSADTKAYIITKLRKWDGTTETDIDSGQSETLVKSGANAVTRTMCIPLTVPFTHFKIGETLRLTVEVWAVTEAGGGGKTCKTTFAFDPQNRDGTYITPSSDSDVTSTASVYIPFKIDL